MNRQTRITRQIADIQESWTKEEKAALVDRIHYHGILTAAKEATLNATVDYADLEEAVKRNRLTFNKPEGMMTGITAIDKMTLGLRKGEMIVLAGPSSHGKTAIALNMAAGVLEQQPHSKVLFISLEMSDLEIAGRIDHISTPEILRHRFRIQQQRRITPLNIGNIIAMHRDYDIVFIDHLHMLAKAGSGMSLYESLNIAVEEIKRLAIEYNLPIVLMSHVSKKRSGDDGTATAADLQGTAAIEQLADFVLMINAEKLDRRNKTLRLEKSRTKQTVGEGAEYTLVTDGLKILPDKPMEDTWLTPEIVAAAERRDYA